jgi:hypothetical protein
MRSLGVFRMAEQQKKAKLMPEGKEYTVSGYTFRTKEAAQEAKTELAAIKYMSSKTDSKDSKQVYILYNSIIDKELFRTPVGMNYLKELQQFLYMADDVPNDKIRPIPINHETKELMDGRREIIENKGVIRRLTDDRNRYKDWFIKSIIVNIVLIIVIAAVIAITANSKNPNVLNYEVNLQDKYSSWQEQLESQEASLKAREQQLNSR